MPLLVVLTMLRTSVVPVVADVWSMSMSLVDPVNVAVMLLSAFPVCVTSISLPSPSMFQF
mgnify:CR=1 FL=1